ncbi:MAG: methylisocitrate lyase [Chloroherpetonaceae bacterium]|nr:methylisocitrate lyase [Chloroherpetonaceae bacterium]MCS7212208.1 methylisocitrate lyase [Chloroherpetonaceae bacterium]MDW8019775.1 methylisocitrate lyase [Chloroherpetonaceae bacterium]
MTWLVQHRSQVSAGARLKTRLLQPAIIKAPGVFNALVALCAKQVGFDTAYFSGAAFSASMGMPDLGLFTLSELADAVRAIVRASDLPLIVDVDTGFGETLNVMRTVKELEEAGAAAVQIEDQVMPKKCGHLDGKEIITAEEMIEKIRAAKSVRKEMLIVARTDAKAIAGIGETIRRANLYAEAGADLIFPEALQSEEEFKLAAKEIQAPLLANMTEFGKTPYISAQQFEDWGYKVVIYPVTSLRVAMKAVEGVFKELLESGTQEKWLERMQTRKELYELIRYHDYESVDKTFALERKF